MLTERMDVESWIKIYQGGKGEEVEKKKEIKVSRKRGKSSNIKKNEERKC